MVGELVTRVPDAGLGNTAYLVDLGDGRALAVDASRDLRGMRTEAERRGLDIAYAADTHVHADFLSGATQLAAKDGAQVLASRLGDRSFQHRGLADEEEVDLGGLTLRALATPGHTDEHLSFALVDGPTVLGVFSGGSLIIGSAARVDLVDPSRVDELARAQYRSLRRLASLGDDAELWPTHGGGSFCSTGAPAGATSTIGAERASNPLLPLDEDDFVKQLIGSHGSFPPYFLRLGDVNRRGPEVIDAVPVVDAVAPDEAEKLVASGATIVDVRGIEAYATSHPTGAVSIPLRPGFASWLGWLVAHDQPVLLLRDADQDLDEVVWQALKIGYENIVGEISGGIDAWTATGLPTSSVPLLGAQDASGLRVLDIRQASEFRAGHLPGALHVELGSLAAVATSLTDEPTVVMCGHGERAAGAVSILEAAGLQRLAILAGGPDDLANARGADLESAG